MTNKNGYSQQHIDTDKMLAEWPTVLDEFGRNTPEVFIPLCDLDGVTYIHATLPCVVDDDGTWWTLDSERAEQLKNRKAKDDIVVREVS